MPIPISKRLALLSVLLVSLAPAAPAQGVGAASMATELSQVDSEWARIEFEIKNPQERLRAVEALRTSEAAVAARNPDRAEPLIWAGILAGQEATLASPFKQIGFAKTALDFFKRAEAIDPDALNGVVSLCLGAIYYRAPGFPIAFGDDRKARRYLEAALNRDPDGLDQNYFYGDFLIEQGEYAKAKTVLVHALDLPPDPDRPVWDAGRRAEVRKLIAVANRHIAR